MLNTWPTNESSKLKDQHGRGAAQAHVPREYLPRLVRGSHWQNLHLPARRESPSDDLHVSIPMQPLQVSRLDCDERATVVNAVDDEPCAARTEVPLTTQSSSTQPGDQL